MGIELGVFKESSSSEELEAANKAAQEFRTEQSTKSVELATRFFKEALEVQTDFRRRLELISQNGDEMSEKEFEKWEDYYADEISYAEDELKQWTDYRPETVAECKKSMILPTSNDGELSNTIEAQAGRFYFSRLSALREAIMSSNDPKAEEDLEYAKGFYPTVLRHLDYVYMSEDDARDHGFAEYDQARTWAHNQVIRYLNGLNDLATKYHVRTFMARNLWPSDTRSKKDQTPAIANMMRYDRDIAGRYYTTAFSAEIEQRERAQKAKQRLFR